MRTLLIAFLALGYSFTAPRPVAPASRSVDPCTLLTAAEVSTALGITSLPGRPFLGSTEVCLFASDTGYDGTKPSVTVMVLTMSAYQNQTHMPGPMAGQPVTGIGDEAYRVGSGSYVKVLVRKGDGAFSITATGGAKPAFTPVQAEQIEEALAKIAVTRI